MKNNPALYHYDEKYIAGKEPQPSEEYIPDYSDPEHQRNEAIKESIALLQIASGKISLPDDDLPAIIWFNRAIGLSNKLRSLGFRGEALQMCKIAHEVISRLSTRPNSDDMHLGNTGVSGNGWTLSLFQLVKLDFLNRASDLYLRLRNICCLVGRFRFSLFCDGTG